jgi:hypothetical protein
MKENELTPAAIMQAPWASGDWADCCEPQPVVLEQWHVDLEARRTEAELVSTGGVDS